MVFEALATHCVGFMGVGGAGRLTLWGELLLQFILYAEIKNILRKMVRHFANPYCHISMF